VSEIPAGFGPLFRSSPVIDLIGPVYSKGEGAELALGLRVEQKHCNMRGALHGGIVATLADIALGYAIAFSTRPPTGLVTANLTLDFAGTAKIGDWLEARVDVQKKGSRLAFANCYLSVGEARIVRASAVFVVAGELAER
jgi:acyl-coenzyme A thioesterase 13